MSKIAVKTGNESAIQWVTFRMEGETYGLNVLTVQEVLRLVDIAPVPGAQSFVLGIINLRGNVVTVLDTRARLNLPSRAPDDQTRIMIVETRKQTIGLLVDSVAEVVEFGEAEMEPAPNVGNEEAARFIRGVASRDNHLYILIDVDKFFGEDDGLAHAA